MPVVPPPHMFHSHLNSKKVSNAICLFLCLAHFLTTSLAWAIEPPDPWSTSSDEASDLSMLKMITGLNQALNTSQKDDQFDAVAFAEKAKEILNENIKIEGTFNNGEYVAILETYQRNYRKTMIVLGEELYRAAHGLPLSQVEIQNLPASLPENTKAGNRDSAYLDSTKANESDRKDRLRRLESIQKLVSALELYSPNVNLENLRPRTLLVVGLPWLVTSLLTTLAFYYWIATAVFRDLMSFDDVKALSIILGLIVEIPHMALQASFPSAAPPRGMLPFYFYRILAEKRQRADFRKALEEGYRAAGLAAGQNEERLNAEIEILRMKEGQQRNQLLCEAALTVGFKLGSAIDTKASEESGLSALELVSKPSRQ